MRILLLFYNCGDAPRHCRFAEAPIPGRVKTRLAATLGAEETARMYEQKVSV